MYICMYVCVCVYIYIYIYIYDQQIYIYYQLISVNMFCFGRWSSRTSSSATIN